MALNVIQDTTHTLTAVPIDEVSDRILRVLVDSDQTVKLTIGDADVPGWLDEHDLLRLRALINKALKVIRP